MSGSSTVNYGGSYPSKVGGIGMPCAAWSAASFAGNGQLWLFGGAATGKFHMPERVVVHFYYNIYIL